MGIRTTREEYWNTLSEEKQREYKIQAQAALSVMAGIGYGIVIAEAFENYLEEK